MAGQGEEVISGMLYCHLPIPSPGSTKSLEAAKVFLPGRLFTHLMADTELELLGYARVLGLRPEWLQAPGTYRAHFDVTGKRLNRVLMDDRVIVLTMEQWTRWLGYRWKRGSGSEPG